MKFTLCSSFNLKTLIFISSDGRTVKVLIVHCYGYVLTAISSVTCEKKGDLNVQSEVRDPAEGARCTVTSSSTRTRFSARSSRR